MAEVKTKPTKQNPNDFLKTIEPEEKRQDSIKILKLMQTITGEKPRMWGTSIIGFGMYHYQSERSAQSGDWPLIGFSPRKQGLTLYIMDDSKEFVKLLKQLGKFSTSKVCVYIKRLSDVDQVVLAKLIKQSFTMAKKQYA